MEKFLEKYETIISKVLLVAAMILISFQVLELCCETVKSLKDRISAVGLDYAPEYARTVVVLFFNVLLSMEILQTIRVYNTEHIVKTRIILIVCLIAACRKVLLLDAKQGHPEEELTVAALILALSIGYFLITRSSASDEKEEG